MEGNQIVHCPPFCYVGCKIQHHPLLLALINVHASQFGNNFTGLDAVMNRYEQLGEWNKDSNIPETNPEYRYPILHWAAALGDLSVVKWLLSTKQCQPLLQTSENGDSVLHRMITCLIDNKRLTTKDKFKAMREIAPYFKNNVMLKNKDGNTPLHLCCICLGKITKPRREYYTEWIKCLLDVMTDNHLMNSQNNNGDTPLHILALLPENYPVIKHILLSHRCKDCFKLDVFNNKGLTVLNVAIRHGNVKISTFLNACIHKPVPLSGDISDSMTQSRLPQHSQDNHIDKKETSRKEKTKAAFSLSKYQKYRKKNVTKKLPVNEIVNPKNSRPCDQSAILSQERFNEKVVSTNMTSTPQAIITHTKTKNQYSTQHESTMPTDLSKSDKEISATTKYQLVPGARQISLIDLSKCSEDAFETSKKNLLAGSQLGNCCMLCSQNKEFIKGVSKPSSQQCSKSNGVNVQSTNSQHMMTSNSCSPCSRGLIYSYRLSNGQGKNLNPLVSQGSSSRTEKSAIQEGNMLIRSDNHIPNMSSPESANYIQSATKNSASDNGCRPANEPKSHGETRPMGSFTNHQRTCSPNVEDDVLLPVSLFGGPNSKALENKRNKGYRPDHGIIDNITETITGLNSSETINTTAEPTTTDWNGNVVTSKTAQRRKYLSTSGKQEGLVKCIKLEDSEDVIVYKVLDNSDESMTSPGCPSSERISSKDIVQRPSKRTSYEKCNQSGIVSYLSMCSDDTKQEFLEKLKKDRDKLVTEKHDIEQQFTDLKDKREKKLELIKCHTKELNSQLEAVYKLQKDIYKMEQEVIDLNKIEKNVMKLNDHKGKQLDTCQNALTELSMI